MRVSGFPENHIMKKGHGNKEKGFVGGCAVPATGEFTRVKGQEDLRARTLPILALSRPPCLPTTVAVPKGHITGNNIYFVKTGSSKRHMRRATNRVRVFPLTTHRSVRTMKFRQGRDNLGKKPCAAPSMPGEQKRGPSIRPNNPRHPGKGFVTDLSKRACSRAQREMHLCLKLASEMTQAEVEPLSCGGSFGK